MKEHAACPGFLGHVSHVGDFLTVGCWIWFHSFHQYLFDESLFFGGVHVQSFVGA